MRTITLGDIRALEPCYDPSRYLPEDWTGTVLDILDIKEAPSPDRIWLATKFIGDRTNRLFAVWCARRALALIANPDPRSVNAVDVAERFANGEATNEELAAAEAAAWDAAGAAAWDAARAAAWAAAWEAQVVQLRKIVCENFQKSGKECMREIGCYG